MMKRLLFVLIFLYSSFTFAGSKFEVHTIEDDQGKACVIAMGMYRREVKSKCDRLKKKVDWDKFTASDCIKKKLSPKKFKATFKVSYSCM